MVRKVVLVQEHFQIGSIRAGGFPWLFEAWAVVLLNVFPWQSAGQAGGVCATLLGGSASLTWLLSEIPRLCRLGQLPHTWQPAGDWNPPTDHP